MSARVIRLGYYHFKTSPSRIVAELVARGIKSELAYYCGEKDIITTNDDFVVNWGYAGRIYKTHKCPDINNRNTLENKLAQKIALFEAGVRTPKPYKISYDTKFPGVPVVLRFLSHHGGDDAKYVETEDEWKKHAPKFVGGYCTEFVDKAAEFRAHITRRGLLYCTKKCIKNKNLLCWNNADERVLNRPQDALVVRRLRIIAAKAIKAISYDFGAVDIMMDDSGVMWVIEVNSAPALENADAVKAYADYIIAESKEC